MPPHEEDFARWLDDPVTRWVLRSYKIAAEDQKTSWVAASWDNGGCSQPMLQELRVRADAYRALSEMTFDDVRAVLGEEPRDE